MYLVCVVHSLISSYSRFQQKPITNNQTATSNLIALGRIKEGSREYPKRIRINLIAYIHRYFIATYRGHIELIILISDMISDTNTTVVGIIGVFEVFMRSAYMNLIKK